MSRTAQDIIEIGRDLATVQLELGSSKFSAWLDAEFGMAPTTAYRFMQVAERFGKGTSVVADLPPSVLYALAAPSTPEPVRAAAVERVKAGEAVTAKAP